ncbi:MAG: ATP-grasp domain-containing protein [Actinobacteria bacterium]|nr:MAG: ATP-grasp domain-containing protein [Actinomycetota bacterium]
MIADASTPVVVMKISLGLGLIRSLGRLGVPVYAVHDRDDSAAARSRYLRDAFVWDVDGAPSRATADFLLDVARRVGGRPILVTTDDVSTMAVADHQAALAEAFRLPLQPDGLARALSDKRAMAELCRRHGIPTPDTEFPSSRADVERFAAETQFPVVLKAIDGGRMDQRGGERTVIAEDAGALLLAYDRLEDPAQPNLMLQQYIPGDPSSVWMFNGYFDERSECRFAAIGRKLRQSPPYTGMTSLGVCAHNPTVDELTRRFMRALGYRGILDCGYRYDARDGRYKLLDVNPRLGGTFRLFVGERGVDVARALYLDLTGQQIPADRVRDGRKWLMEPYDVRTFLALRGDGRLGARRWARSLRGVDEAAFFAADDLAPFVAMALLGAGTALHRGLRLGRVGVREPSIY